MQAWTNGDAAVFGGTAGDREPCLRDDQRSVPAVHHQRLYDSSNTLNLPSGGTSIDVASGSTAKISSVIAGSGALTTMDSGTLILRGRNTYSGGTSITGGTVQTTSANGLGSGTVTVNNGALTVNYGSAGYTFSNAIVGTGTVNLTAANAD